MTGRHIVTSPSDHAEPARADQAEVTAPDDAAVRRLAVRRLKKKREFQTHVFVYVAVNTALWLVWIVGGILDEWIFPWPFFPTVFWGLFVLGQARDLHGREPFSEEQVQREIERLRAGAGTRAPDTYGSGHDDWRWPPPPRMFTRHSRDE